MTGTSVSPDVPPKDEEVVKLNYSFKEACKINIWPLVFNFFKVLTSVWLFLKYWNSDLPTHRFFLYYISIPLMVCSLTKTICTAFSIFALTQSTVRFLYVDVFYINIFRELVNTTYWTYLLVLIFSPYYFSLSTRVNLAFLAAIFVSLIVQSVLVITYTCSVYFRAQRLQSFLSKFWFVRLLIIVGSGLTAVSCFSNYPIGKLNIGNLVTSLFTSRYGMKHKSIRTVFVTHVRVSSYCLSQPSMAHRLSSPIFPCWFVCRAIA